MLRSVNAVSHQHIIDRPGRAGSLPLEAPPERSRSRQSVISPIILDCLGQDSRPPAPRAVRIPTCPSMCIWRQSFDITTTYTSRHHRLGGCPMPFLVVVEVVDEEVGSARLGPYARMPLSGLSQLPNPFKTAFGRRDTTYLLDWARQFRPLTHESVRTVSSRRVLNECSVPTEYFADAPL
jgi:hypothetical protein